MVRSAGVLGQLIIGDVICANLVPDTDVTYVQNNYNLAYRPDEAVIDALAPAGHRVRAVLPATRALVGAIVQVQ
jgi:hypothetical protein